jgi:hypothetical protein
MTTTENADRSITLPAEEIGFLLDYAEQAAGDGAKVSDADLDRLASLRSIVADTDMPLDGFPVAPQAYLLIKDNGGYDAVTVCRVFASEDEALRTMKILNEFSSDTFEVQSVIFEP